MVLHSSIYSSRFFLCQLSYVFILTGLANQPVCLVRISTIKLNTLKIHLINCSYHVSVQDTPLASVLQFIIQINDP